MESPTLSSSQSPIISPSSPEQYVMYKRRWIGLSAIFILNVSTSFVWLTFNAVPDITATWLNASLTETNLTVILYFIGYIVMAPFSGFAFEKYGVKKSLIIGSVFNIVGCTTRYLATFIHSSQESNQARISVILLGQFLAAMSQPYFLNSPAKYAAVWFGDNSRATCITIGTTANPIAAAFAMVLIPVICDDPSGKDIPLTLAIIAGMAIFALIPTLLMPEAPPTPPSPSAEQALAQFANQPFWKSIQECYRNRHFLILWAAFSISVGLFNSFSSLINQIVTPYGYDDDTAGVFGASLIVSGVIGAGISGVFIDKTKKYRQVLRACSPIACASYVAFVFMVRENNTAAICAVVAILGFFSFALLPVALELGAECTYPAPISSSTTLLWMGGQICAVIFLVVGDELRNEDGDPPKNMKVALIGAAALSCFTAIIVYFYNSKNKRTLAEAEDREKSQARISHVIM